MSLGKVEAQPLDLTKYLDPVVKNNIQAMGIELEGGWSKMPTGTGFNQHRDTSVQVGLGASLSCPEPIIWVGEIVSDPLQPAGVPLWMKKAWPQRINQSCGLHVHMSFMTLYQYNLLTVPEYQETILHYLTRWGEKEGLPKRHTLWSRLAGDSVYCRKLFWPDSQIQAKTKVYHRDEDGHRYTIINYPLKQHGTIEVRVLPMFETWEQGYRAVKLVQDVTNACLCLLSTQKQERLKHTVFITDGDNYDKETHRDIL